METIGTLAGGIAHDYNNLLTVIMGNLSMAQEETDPHSITAELLHEIEQASLKAKDLTHQFLALSQGADQDRSGCKGHCMQRLFQ